MAYFRDFNKWERELYLKKQVEVLRDMYKSTQEKLTRRLMSLDLTEFQRWRTEELLKQTKDMIKALDKDAIKWVKETIPVAYKRGFDIASERLRMMGVVEDVDFSTRIHTSAVSILSDAVATDLLSANNSALKFINGYIRRTQQKILEDWKISRMIAEGIISGEARRTTSDRLLQEFQKRIKNGQVIVINGRHYDMGSYAELVARTRTREATTQATINTAIDNDVDLVQVSVHADACEYCQQFQGRVFSISGNDPEFPKLTEEPPYHPNCECILLPVTKEHLRRRLRDNYKNLVDLSNSKVKIESWSAYDRYLRGIA